MSWLLKDDRLAVALSKENDALWVEITELKTGKVWPKTPLLTLFTHEKALRRTCPMSKYRIDLVEEGLGGLHIVIGHKLGGIDIGMWLRVKDGEFSVLLSPAEVYERQPALFRLFAIDVLPGLMSAPAGGRVFLPINTGVAFDPGTKPALNDRFLVYGEQDRWELMPSFPVCGASSAEGGMMAIAIEGAEDADCRVQTDGKGNGSVSFAFSLRQFWPDPVDMQRREFRFAPIPADADPIVFIAKRLRRHVIEDLGKKTLAERVKESPELAYVLDAYIMKLFHGVENVGYMMQDQKKGSSVSFVNCMTFAEARDCIKMLHDAGVPKVLTQSVGWNMRGHDGAYPVRFPVEERLGGEEGFRELIAFGNSLGYNMNVHDNYMMMNLAAPGVDRDLITQDIYGDPLIHGYWAGGIECSSWLPAFPQELILEHMQRVKDLGVKGMYYMDYMGQPLEVNYHPKYKGSRGDFARGTMKLIRTAAKEFGSAACESGFLYNAIDADLVASRPSPFHLMHCETFWPITQLIEEIVPIWQIALHGLVANENAGTPTWGRAMDTVLFGDHPRDEWSVRPFVMPEMNPTRARAHKAMYDLAIADYGHLQLVELMDNKEIAKGVRESRFADGTVVTVDSKKQELFINGKNIARPEGFLDK